MKNIITVKKYGSKILKIYKHQLDKRLTCYELENGNNITGTEIRKLRVVINCNECNSLSEVTFYTGILKRTYICTKCLHTGSRNPFYGKKHSPELIKRLSDERKGVWGVGENNPFYGKKHSHRTRKYLSEINIKKAKAANYKNPFYGKKHSPEIIKHLSDVTKKWAKLHPEHYVANGIKSVTKQLKGRKTSIEKKVELELKKLGFSDFKYNKIFNHFQYDFCINKNILLEVQGDFWHANPLFYGDKKKPLSDRQKFKVNRDIEKRIFAESLGYKLYYIWENDINNNDFSVLVKIKESLENAN